MADETEAKPEGPGKRQISQYHKYAAINITFYIVMAFSSYVNVFLQSIGFNAQQVGMMTAINSGVGIFSSPFWGMLSDKLRSLKKVISITLIAGTLLFALIPWFGGMSMGRISILFFVIPIIQFFRMPSFGLIDNWVLRNAAREKLNFGALRGYGALGYAVSAMALGFIIPRTGVNLVFYLGLVLTIPPLLMLVFTKSSAEDEGAGKKTLTFKEMQIGQLFKNYYLLTFILFSVVLRIPFQSSMIFLPFLVADTGGDIAQLGIIMGIRAFIEIPMMRLLKPLRQRIPLYIIIMIAMVFFVVECLMYSLADSFRMVIIISILHGLGNGLMLPTTVSYVFFLAPDHLKATAQSFLASMNAIAGILGGLIGGLLIVRLDIKQFYFIIGIMLAAALALFVASFFIGEKILAIKRPGLSLN